MNLLVGALFSQESLVSISTSELDYEDNKLEVRVSYTKIDGKI